MSEYRVAPMTLAKANALVEVLHRHHGPLAFHIASIGAERRTDNHIVGAATLLRPCSPVQDDKVTIELARLTTDGSRNACSFLLGACARLAWSLGYLRIQTYTMAEESGSSLRAAGWRLEILSPGTKWNRPNRPRADNHIIGPRVRWAAFAPEVFSMCDTQKRDPAFILGESAGRSGAAQDSNPFCAGEEPVQWEMWREGWECAYCYRDIIS